MNRRSDQANSKNSTEVTSGTKTASSAVAKTAQAIFKVTQKTTVESIKAEQRIRATIKSTATTVNDFIVAVKCPVLESDLRNSQVLNWSE